MSSNTSGSASAVGTCEALLKQGRVHDVLAWLNGRTRHRFTGLYMFDPPLLRNLALYDRENPELVRAGTVPLAETYCSRVGDDRSPFATPNAAEDPRLAGHAARACVLAYCGVPVRDHEGAVFGSLCHYDTRPRLVREDEMGLLAAVAEKITPHALLLARRTA